MWKVGATCKRLQREDSDEISERVCKDGGGDGRRNCGKSWDGWQGMGAKREFHHGEDLSGYSTNNWRGGPEHFWIVPRTFGEGDLRGSLRAGIEAGGRERVPQGCDGRSEVDGCADRAVSGRQFRFGIPLAGRRGTEGKTAEAGGEGLGFGGDESVRIERIHVVVQGGGHSSAAGNEFWDGDSGASGGAAGILQRGTRNEVE